MKILLIHIIILFISKGAFMSVVGEDRNSYVEFQSYDDAPELEVTGIVIKLRELKKDGKIILLGKYRADGKLIKECNKPLVHCLKISINSDALKKEVLKDLLILWEEFEDPNDYKNTKYSKYYWRGGQFKIELHKFFRKELEKGKQFTVYTSLSSYKSNVVSFSRSDFSLQNTDKK